MTTMDAPPAFSITSRTEPDYYRVKVAGELDLATCPGLERQLDSRSLASAPSVLVDFGGVTFIDSRGIAVLMQAAQRCRESGRPFRLVNLTEPVRRTLEVAGVLDSIVVG